MGLAREKGTFSLTRDDALVQTVFFTGVAVPCTVGDDGRVPRWDLEMESSSMKNTAAAVCACDECAGRYSHGDVHLGGLAERSSTRYVIVLTMYVCGILLHKHLIAATGC